MLCRNSWFQHTCIAWCQTCQSDLHIRNIITSQQKNFIETTADFMFEEFSFTGGFIFLKLWCSTGYPSNNLLYFLRGFWGSWSSYDPLHSLSCTCHATETNSSTIIHHYLITYISKGYSIIHTQRTLFLKPLLHVVSKIYPNCL